MVLCVQSVYYSFEKDFHVHHFGLILIKTGADPKDLMTPAVLFGHRHTMVSHDLRQVTETEGDKGERRERRREPWEARENESILIFLISSMTIYLKF